MIAAPVPWLAGAVVGLGAALPLARRARRVAVAHQALGIVAGEDRAGGTRGSRRLRRSVGAWLRAAPVLAVVVRVGGGLAARRRGARDAERLARELPLLADLLAVAVGAGCTPFLAVEAAARWAPAACSARLRAVLRACELGVGFDVALTELATSTPPLRPLADALAVSERTGAPIAPALARLADDARASTRRRAEAKARTVPVRLLFPLVFLVLPAFALLTVAPALLSGLTRT